MVQRRSTVAGSRVQAPLRDRMLADYRRRAERVCSIPDASAAVFRDSRSAAIVAALKAGAPVVVAAWELARYDVPGLVRESGRHYRVESDGRAVEVDPVRDPTQPSSIIAWEASHE